MTSRHAYLVCPLGEYRRFYQIDVVKEWTEGRIRIFHQQCEGVISFARDPKHDYFTCRRCGSRLTVLRDEAFPTIRAVAIDRAGTHSLNPQIQFTYLDPAQLPPDS